MSQERLKHHGSPNGCLPTGVPDEFPNEAEGRSAESARADILCRQDDARCGRSSRCAFHLQALGYFVAPVCVKIDASACQLKEERARVLC